MTCIFHLDSPAIKLKKVSIPREMMDMAPLAVKRVFVINPSMRFEIGFFFCGVLKRSVAETDDNGKWRFTTKDCALSMPEADRTQTFPFPVTGTTPEVGTARTTLV